MRCLGGGYVRKAPARKSNATKSARKLMAVKMASMRVEQRCMRLQLIHRDYPQDFFECGLPSEARRCKPRDHIVFIP